MINIIDSVAETKAECHVKLWMKVCKKEECANCSTNIKYNNCYNQLSDAEQLALDNIVYKKFWNKQKAVKRERSDKRSLNTTLAISVALILSGIICIKVGGGGVASFVGFLLVVFGFFCLLPCILLLAQG